MNRLAAGALQLADGMLAGEGQQALQGPDRLGSALGHQALGPRPAVCTHHPATLHHVVGAALDDDALVGVDVGVIGGEAAGLGPDMDGDRLEVLIEDADQPGLGPDPHIAAEVLGRHRVVGPLKGMVAYQILINALGGEADLHGGLDLGGQRLTETRRTGVRAEGQVSGWF